MSAFLPHPRKGFWATSAAGEGIQVMFLQEATQSMAMTAQGSSTPYNPCTLNLPSISALISFYHACLGFPVKQTWLDAIKEGNCDTFNGLTYSNMARYCPNANKTILEHLAQQHQNVTSTKPKRPPPCHLQHCPPLPLIPRMCHPIKSSSSCTPSAGCTQITRAAFLSGHARGTNTS
jgi:hypothetical protein